MNKWLMQLDQNNQAVAIVNKQWNLHDHEQFYHYYERLETGLKDQQVLKLSPFYLAKLIASGLQSHQIDQLFDHLSELKDHYQKLKPAAATTLFKQIQQLYQATNRSKYYPLNALINQIKALIANQPVQINLHQIEQKSNWQDWD